MPVNSLVEQYIQKLREELELPAQGPKEDRGFKLELGPEMSLFLKEQDPGISFFSTIGPLPEKKREELFILLMKANFLGQGTGGSVIGLDREEKLLTLSSNIPYDMNYKTFKESVEDFANFVDYWKKELLRHSEQAEKSLMT
jgi:hypothetical protein